jgi:hypothetical protein
MKNRIYNLYHFYIIFRCTSKNINDFSPDYILEKFESFFGFLPEVTKDYNTSEFYNRWDNNDIRVKAIVHFLMTSNLNSINNIINNFNIHFNNTFENTNKELHYSVHPVIKSFTENIFKRKKIKRQLEIILINS